MDPDACLLSLLRALAENDRDESVGRLRDLAQWLERGGCFPRTSGLVRPVGVAHTPEEAAANRLRSPRYELRPVAGGTFGRYVDLDAAKQRACEIWPGAIFAVADPLTPLMTLGAWGELVLQPARIKVFRDLVDVEEAAEPVAMIEPMS